MLEKLCLQLTNKPFQINVFHIDFEKAAHNAVLEKFPNCVIVCCNFHLGQSWYLNFLLTYTKLFTTRMLKNNRL